MDQDDVVLLKLREKCSEGSDDACRTLERLCADGRDDACRYVPQ
ncbi:hypothetical protein [Haloplanus aerogenes]|uniref:Uncharacterized protein n=1 Tax=Haloplanus aerogenes TaxID=660522 RepID=A0A3M0DT51_9EURY|nr:hypothetical protein [Haloplanus aerogenes]RMB18503.1 hypothetical protein ATH50_1964 [Haloplanus aerogenes]